MINGEWRFWFFLDIRKYLALSKRAHQKDKWGVHQARKFDREEFSGGQRSEFCTFWLFLWLFLFKCYFYSHDNASRCRIKNVAGKWDLYLYVSDGFMTLCKLGVGSGRGWHINFITPVSVQSPRCTGAPHSRTNIPMLRARPEQLTCSSSLS